MNYHKIVTILLPILIFLTFRGTCQQELKRERVFIYPSADRMRDSLKAVSLPLLNFPARYHNRSLPPVVDNSKNDYWPGILDQGNFYSCQQYAGVAYTFGYEINRMRNQPGGSWENRYPAHYSWTLKNQGQRYIGVNFLQSFDLIRDQGHMTNRYFGTDTAGSYLGWASGYDKYYHGMFNRLKQVYAIEINSEEGINTLRNYLYDHLDGSPTGGIACFTTDSYALYLMVQLPLGTPEAGKQLVMSWTSDPDHGLTIVGYNDSIRYDVNQDGMFTNNVDINGDGVVDVKDWEIGAFKFANSYGGWWADTGYAYVLYRAMACNFEEGGVWNNRVYVVQPDITSHPLVTLKVKMNYNNRQNIRLVAGINRDTLAQLPEHMITFPAFNFQGGAHEMTGIDNYPDQKSIELGLDVTPLLNYMDNGKPARFFLGVEERDPGHSGQGVIEKVSLMGYVQGEKEFKSEEENVTIEDNATTFVSMVAGFNIPKVTITTQELPGYTTGIPYQVQLQASGGQPDYRWELEEKYSKQSFVAPMPDSTGMMMLTQVSHYKPYAVKALPFSFPFYGKPRDSIYINFQGFVSFEPQVLPPPYITDELAMLKMYPVISPAFSQEYQYLPELNEGVFYQADNSRVMIRWKTKSNSGSINSESNFALILYPDGTFEFRYGATDAGYNISTVYTGISKGDETNFDLDPLWNIRDNNGKAIRYLPSGSPGGINITPQGMLTVSQIDSTRIFPVTIKVTDQENLSDVREYQLSSGLTLDCHVVSGNDNLFKFGEQASLKLSVQNTGLQTLQNLILTLSSDDTACIISNDSFSLAALGPGEKRVIEKAFEFSLDQPCADGYPVRFSIVATDGTRPWNKTFDLQVAAPLVKILTPQLQDGDNNILDAGEVANLVVTMVNNGSLSTPPTEMSLESMDTTLVVVSDPIQYLDNLGPRSKTDLNFLVKRSRFAAPGKPSPMMVKITSSGKTILTMDFSLPAMRKQVAVVRRTTTGTSFQAMQTALDNLHVDYDTLSHLDFAYSDYHCIFLLLGYGTQGSSTLTNTEAMALAGYLQKHGNLYMEGYYTWYYTKTQYLHPYFYYQSTLCPIYFFNRVNGLPSTLSDSMTFACSGSPDYALFSFIPRDPGYITFGNDHNPPNALEIVYDGEDYKTIGSIPEFGSLVDSAQTPSTRQTLMERYLNFFKIDLTNLHALFHTSQNQVPRGTEVAFTDDSFDHIQSWQWEFPGGTPATSSLQNPVVRYDIPGKYDVKLTVTDGKNTKTLTRKNYIEVKPVTGVDQVSLLSRFRIYPNPTSDLLVIERKEPSNIPVTFSLTDYSGRVVLKKEIKSENAMGPVTLNLGGLKPGIYFLRIQTPTSQEVAKVIVN